MNEDVISIDARLDRPRVWARDLALVGAITALPLALWRYLPLSTALIAVALAAASGAVLGALVPRLLHRRVRRKPLVLLVPAAVGLGALWGAAVGLPAAWITHAPWIRVTELAASAGAAQLGWLWVPHAIGVARRGSSWPTVALACMAAPLIGWLAYVHVTW